MSFEKEKSNLNQIPQSEKQDLNEFLNSNFTKILKLTPTQTIKILDMKQWKFFHDTFYKKWNKNFDQLYEFSSKIDKIYRELAKLGIKDRTIPISAIVGFIQRNQQIDTKIAKLKKTKNAEKLIKDEYITKQKVYKNLINSWEFHTQTLPDKILNNINDPNWQIIIWNVSRVIWWVIWWRFAKNPEVWKRIGYTVWKIIWKVVDDRKKLDTNEIIWNLAQDLPFLNKLKEGFNYEVNELNIPLKYIDLVEKSGFLTPTKSIPTINERYKRFNETNKIDFQTFINTYVASNPYWIDLLDAYLIFWYTDYIFTDNMNEKLREWEPLDENQKNLVNKLRQALEKLPDSKWKLEVLYRWDNHNFKNKQEWESVHLKAFTSCSNPPTEPFRTEATYKVTINNAKAKDITKLALFPNFWDRLKVKKNGKWIQGEKTAQESVILPWNKVEILSKSSKIEQWKTVFNFSVKQL